MTVHSLELSSAGYQGLGLERATDAATCAALTSAEMC